MNSRVYVLTALALASVLILDLLHAWTQRCKETSMKAASLMTVFYVSLAVAFGLLLPHWTSSDSQKAFFASWLTEYSLSLDNLFVFILIFSRLKVPKAKQELTLLFGISFSLVLRAIFLLFGVSVVQKWAFTLFFFGGFLVYTSIQIFREDPEDEWQDGKILKYLTRKQYSLNAIALVTIATTDLMFAFDSIPAVIGITKEPYIILCSNFFALMGLRQLYFLVEKLLKKLVYLSLGLAIILLFIGTKLIFEALHDYGITQLLGISIPVISLEVSLTFIVLVLLTITFASLLKRQKPRFPM
jgi:tellurite resistance protein TerC